MQIRCSNKVPESRAVFTYGFAFGFTSQFMDPFLDMNKCHVSNYCRFQILSFVVFKPLKRFSKDGATLVLLIG